jgi:HAE1 family hydrophobic/amphiphilic exporter-1
MHFLTRIAIWKRWLTFLIAAAITGAAVFFTLQLKMELIPDIDLPAVSVVSVYPGAPAETIAEQVTSKVEEAIVSVKKPDELTSTSSQNVSFTIAWYDFGTDMEKVNTEIQRKLDALELPPGVAIPQLYPINMNAIPIVILNVSGDHSPSEIREIAETQIAPRLKQVDGAFAVEVEGTKEQVTVTLDTDRLTKLGVSAGQIAAAIKMSEGAFTSLEQIANIPLMPSVSGQPTAGTRIADVAEVTLGLAPGTQITRTNGNPSVAIIVNKTQEANTVQVANALIKEVENIKRDLGPDIVFYTVMDQSDYIENSIQDLVRDAIIGGVLAVVIILLFLLSFSASIVTAISIPLSIFIGFMVMYFWGITINILTLSAMAIAVGRVVDDSIVILEVIYRRMKHGESFREAALGGSREIATAITSATLATVAIFIPLAFVGGIVGEMFRPFALTATFALLASLLVALTVIPSLCAYLIRSRVRATEENPTPPKDTWYQRIYVRVLHWALAHRAITITIAIALFIGSFALVPLIGTSFMPSSGEPTLTVDIDPPAGTDPQLTFDKVVQVEEIIKDNLKPRVYQTTVGESSGMTGMYSALMGGGQSSASITVGLEPDTNTTEAAEKLRRLLLPITDEGDKIKVSTSSGSGMAGFSSSSLEITVTGEDTQAVFQAVSRIQSEIRSIGGLTNIENDAARVIMQPDIQINPVSVTAKGLDPQLLQQELAMLLMGGAVGQASLAGRSYEIALAPVLPAIKDPAQIQNLKVGFQQMSNLSDVSTITIQPKPTYIRHIDRQRAVKISGTITQKDVGAANRTVQEKLDSMSLPPGVTAGMGGVSEEMSKAFRQLGISILAAIGISYVVMVLTLRSLASPFIIMFSLPLASVGALTALAITGRSLGVSAMMGSLMLVGIVLTNAIVLIVVVDQLRRSGYSTHEALVEGGRLRLRPILMTAIVTIFALLPLALGFGQGVLIAAELGTVVIGGLFTSTLLTLIVVPVIYSLFDSLKTRIGQSRHRS